MITHVRTCKCKTKENQKLTQPNENNSRKFKNLQNNKLKILSICSLYSKGLVKSTGIFTILFYFGKISSHNFYVFILN